MKKDLCNMCGACCKAIMIPKSMDQVKEIAEHNDKQDESGEYLQDRLTDAQFVRDNWVQIKARDVMRINPFIYSTIVSNMIKFMAHRRLSFPSALIPASMHEKLDWYGSVRQKFGFQGSMYFYKCTKHDPTTNQCTVHNERPKVCSDYPYYSSESIPDGEVWYDEKCGYKDWKMYKLNVKGEQPGTLS